MCPSTLTLDVLQVFGRSVHFPMACLTFTSERALEGEGGGWRGRRRRRRVQPLFFFGALFSVKSDYWMAASPFHGSSGRLRRWLPRPRTVQVFTPLTPVGIKASIRTSFALSPLPNKAGLRSKRRFNWAHRPDWKRATGGTKHRSKKHSSLILLGTLAFS